MKKRLNLYEISNILGFLYQDDVINLPAISTVNDIIGILGYEGKFGLDKAGRPAFRPKKDETQYTISDDGEVVPYAVDYIDEGTDKGRKSIGNCFATKEEAEQAVEKLKAWKRLKDAGFKFDHIEGSFDLPPRMFRIICKIPEKTMEQDLNLLFGDEKRQKELRMIKAECCQCHKQQIFPTVSTAQMYGWDVINSRWYCPSCDIGGEE